MPGRHHFDVVWKVSAVGMKKVDYVQGMRVRNFAAIMHLFKLPRENLTKVVGRAVNRSSAV